MRCVLMVGPARSGTSITAAVCQALGVNLSGDLIGPHEDHNPVGHFESYAWHVLNRRIRDAGGDITPADRDEYLRLIWRDRAEPVWGVKDPAFCYTLPDVVGIVREAGDEPRVVAIHRPFRCSVRSREKHSQLSPSESARLQVAERSAFYRSLLTVQEAGVPVHHVDYDRLVCTTQREVSALAQFAVGGVDRDRIQAACQLVDPGLRHHVGAFYAEG